MNAYLDALGRWFQSLGVHPVLGALVLGAGIAAVFAYRRTRDATEPVQPYPVVPPVPSAATGPTFAHAFQGRSIDIPAEVMAHLQNGQQIEAIKALRQALGIGLKEAKDIVDSLPRTGR